jgi:hypothetical protein
LLDILFAMQWHPRTFSKMFHFFLVGLLFI